ncbi:MAG TPA: adenylate/guanylate cyclase domain-containing protein [Myxococcales bacterium]|nr:adenylate/guanylate cyclase domain-containing protein [Myxococcales bacterium]
MQPETQFARGRDGDLAYQVVGDGPLDLVFIPSWLTNVDAMWEEPSLAGFLRRVATFSRMLCFDKRGSGVSDPVPLAAVPTLEQWMADVATVMDAAHVERAALLGSAEGGPMAMLFAATHPERTSALILVDTSARMLRDTDYPWGVPADRVPRLLERLKDRWGTGRTVEFLAPSAAHDERFRRWLARYERLSITPQAHIPMYASHFEWDLRGVLPSIRVPTLVLHRSGDPHIRVGHARYLAEHIPRAKYVELPGEDHLFFVGDTEAMLAEIEEFLTGVRPVPEIDRVLATVLFTDIVGSTERAAALGDRAWRALLDTHHRIVRQELERHRGREVKTIGDGFLATFDGPARAIRCACAIRDAVRPLGIEVRAGLHTGECELMDDDVGGIAVHIGARVTASAGPGEVVVSRTVKDLVAGSGLRFVDRGARGLHGVPGEWRLFAVET